MTKRERKKAKNTSKYKWVYLFTVLTLITKKTVNKTSSSRKIQILAVSHYSVSAVLQYIHKSKHREIIS